MTLLAPKINNPWTPACPSSPWLHLSNELLPDKSIQPKDETSHAHLESNAGHFQEHNPASHFTAGFCNWEDLVPVDDAGLSPGF